MAAYTWESLYRKLKPQPVTYSTAIVSYLDILGFRELVASRTAGEISHILRVLAESVKPHLTEEPAKIEFTRFSDTVIRSVSQVSVAYLIYELKNLVHAQMALIPHGVTVRGTVTVGKIVQSWGVVYGPAVVRAYDLESVKGCPPRIVIDDAALNLFNPPIDKDWFEPDLSGLVKKEGSTLFLNYLRACEIELNVETQEYLVFLALHRDFIRSNLTKFANDPKVLPKYEWLKSYHEGTLEERFGADVPQHLRV